MMTRHKTRKDATWQHVDPLTTSLLFAMVVNWGLHVLLNVQNSQLLEIGVFYGYSGHQRCAKIILFIFRRNIYWRPNS